MPAETPELEQVLKDQLKLYSAADVASADLEAFELILGKSGVTTRAVVSIGYKLHLHWMRHHFKWGLYVTHGGQGDDHPCPVLSTGAVEKVRAAKQLERLWEIICSNARVLADQATQ